LRTGDCDSESSEQLSFGKWLDEPLHDPLASRAVIEVRLDTG
jgi:hypothetical protein